MYAEIRAYLHVHHSFMYNERKTSYEVGERRAHDQPTISEFTH